MPYISSIDCDKTGFCRPVRLQGNKRDRFADSLGVSAAPQIQKPTHASCALQDLRQSSAACATSNRSREHFVPRAQIRKGFGIYRLSTWPDREGRGLQDQRFSSEGPSHASGPAKSRGSSSARPEPPQEPIIQARARLVLGGLAGTCQST